MKDLDIVNTTGWINIECRTDNSVEVWLGDDNKDCGKVILNKYEVTKLVEWLINYLDKDIK